MGAEGCLSKSYGARPVVLIAIRAVKLWAFTPDAMQRFAAHSRPSYHAAEELRLLSSCGVAGSVDRPTCY